jgi:hypothetical protein
MLAQHADPQLTIRPTGSASKSRLTLKLVPFVGPTSASNQSCAAASV